jgi:hypothetical protein
VKARPTRSDRQSLVNASDAPEIVHVTRLRPAGDFIEQADGCGFQARLSRVIGWIIDLNLDFNRVTAALNPTLSFFFALVHEGVSQPVKTILRSLLVASR